MINDTWELSSVYEQYVGRWSRLVAAEFLEWLNLPTRQVWADVGCGSGALVEGILTSTKASEVFAIDKSSGFISETHSRVNNPRAQFCIADAQALPWKTALCDASVSGLVLNFVPDAQAMVIEMRRVTRPNGTVAVYVWDYGAGMEMMRYFWDVVRELNPQHAAHDEAERFPICQPGPLSTLFQSAGLGSISVTAISIPTVFRSFDDYWQPFLGRQGSAPSYLASLDELGRERIRERLNERLKVANDGSITMRAKAWAVRGMVPLG